MSIKSTLTEVREKGNLVVDTQTLMAVITDSNQGEPRNRAIDTKLFLDLDPSGNHLLTRVMLHNDMEWRCQFYVKVNGTMDPVVLWQDVPLDIWARLEAAFDRQLALL